MNAEFKPGLEGVIAAETQLSGVFGDAGRLIIQGQDVHDLTSTLSFEDTAVKLWTGRLTTSETMTGALQTARRECAEILQKHPTILDARTVLEGLRTALSLLPDEKPEKDILLLTAMVPVATAALLRHANGDAVIAPHPDLGQAADFLYMLGGVAPSPARATAFERYLVTVSDHGMNASTFTGRVVASTQAGVISTVIAALCALKGPLHGGAPGPVLDMLDEIQELGDAKAWVDQALRKGDRLMGFGHRIYRTRDPRADVLKEALSTYRGAEDNARLRFAEDVERVIQNRLKEKYPDRPLDTNVEFYTALLLEAVGLPRQAFTAAFAMGRILGWIAHHFEQVETGRLMRPASRYTGNMPD